MRFTDLQPRFLRRAGDERETWECEGITIERADGVCFLCPKCLKANGGYAPGVHSIVCWRPTVPVNVSPGPGRWDLQGTGFENLSLVASSSSVALNGGCKAHFFVRNGEIVDA